MLYTYLKVLHIFLVISWFAGLFYLPRILVNLALDAHPEVQKRLQTMAHKLYRFTFLLAHLATASGFILWWKLMPHAGGWVHAKFTLVLGLWVYQWFCKRALKQFIDGNNNKSHIYFRWFNEIPVFFLLGILYLAVFKPF